MVQKTITLTLTIPLAVVIDRLNPEAAAFMVEQKLRAMKDDLSDPDGASSARTWLTRCWYAQCALQEALLQAPNDLMRFVVASALSRLNEDAEEILAAIPPIGTDVQGAITPIAERLGQQSFLREAELHGFEEMFGDFLAATTVSIGKPTLAPATTETT